MGEIAIEEEATISQQWAGKATVDQRRLRTKEDGGQGQRAEGTENLNHLGAHRSQIIS
jgi:hypothetical protein